MDIKGLTTRIAGKNLDEGKIIKPSVASSDQAPHSSGSMSPQTIKAIQAMLQSLQLSKVFDVIVTRVEGDMVTLQIPGSPADAPVLQAQIKSPPPLGTRLTLQLSDDVAKPELKVIATPNSPQDVVSRNLRVNLQQQQAMPPLLANLAQVAKGADTTPVDLPEVIIDTIKAVLQQLPSQDKVTVPRGLKQALQQSGPFLEALLAAQKLPDAKTRPEPLPELYSRAPTVVTDKNSVQIPELSKQLRYEIASQTVQMLSQAMQTQPLQDVRGNLLRLATLIRAAAELHHLQKNAFNDLNTTTDNKGSAPGGRPSATSPLPATLMTDRPATVKDGLTTGVRPTGMTSEQPPPQNQAVRSQTPQAQAQAQASILNTLDADSAMDELLGQIDGVLTRIQVQQLQTAATEQQHRPVWVMELPVRTDQGIDLFDIRIQREREGFKEDDPKAPWVVSLAFDLEKLGAIRARISLYGDDRISTTFWAEQPETSTYFNQHLDRLKSRLKQVGLEVANLNCRCGRPDSPPPSYEPRLVDEKV